MFNLFSKKKKISQGTEITDDVLAIISVLVEAANIDEVFEEREKNIISTIIQKQFSISDIKIVNETIDKVNKSLAESGDLVSHTKKIKNSWSLDKRKKIIEMLWKVCLVDNSLDPYEDMLIRKIAGLLYVDPKDCNEAKQKVLKT
tara:strand:+ start:1765 stop:2199 length:435 start_codon:yes stop_codon:yes gene_type:complete